MSTVAGSVVVAIKAVDEASSVFDKIQASMGILGSSLSSLGGGFSGLGSVISGFAAGGVVGAAAAGVGQLIQGLQWATKEASENQQAWADLQAALRLTGPAWDAARSKIDEFASTVQKTTTFSDEMVVGAVQRMATFGMSYEQGMTAVSAAIELAAAKHIDLQTATDLLGKAFMGNTAILSRYGIDIDAVKEGLGKGATEAQVYEAVLAKLNEQFGGTAAAQAQTYAGAQERLKNAMSDLGEKVGGIVLPALAGFTEAMIPAVDWLTQGVTQAQGWIDTLSKMPEVKAASDALSNAFSGLQRWFGNVASAAMEELGPALMELWDAFKEVAVALEPVWEALGEIWAAFSEGEGSGNILKDILGIVAESIKSIAFVIKEIAPYIKMIAGAMKEAADLIVSPIQAMMKTIGEFIAWLHDTFQGFYNWLVGKSLWQEMWGVVANATTQMAAQILSSLSKSLLDPMRNAISNTLQTIKNMWDSAMRGLADAAKNLWNLLTGHSIWTDMLSQMVVQTQDAMSAIQGEFNQGLTGPTGIVPAVEAAQPTVAQGVGGAAAGAAVGAQAITLPIYIYLDGQQILALLERRQVETIKRDAGRSRRA